MIGPWDRIERWGMNFRYGHQMPRKMPQRCSGFDFVSRSGESQQPPIRKAELAQIPTWTPQPMLITIKNIKPHSLVALSWLTPEAICVYSHLG